MVHVGLFQQLEILRDSGKSKKANWYHSVNKVHNVLYSVQVISD